MNLDPNYALLNEAGLNKQPTLPQEPGFQLEELANDASIRKDVEA